MRLEKVECYLRRLGFSVVGKALPSDALARLPLFVTGSIQLEMVELAGGLRCLAALKNSVDDPGRIVALGEALRRAQLDPVLCIESNDRGFCEYLKSHDVHYVVPGRQIYLPPNAVLVSDRAYAGSDRMKRKCMTPKAQQLLFWYLLSGDLPESMPYALIRERLAFQVFEITRAVQCLVQLGLAEIRHDWPNAVVVFKGSRRALWNRAKSCMCSPVKTTLRCAKVPEGALLAGISALAEQTDLVDRGCATYALGEAQAGVLQGNNSSAYEGYPVEVWKYSPDSIPHEVGRVDVLSLYASLKKDKDPRVDLAMTELEGRMF